MKKSGALKIPISMDISQAVINTMKSARETESDMVLTTHEDWVKYCQSYSEASLRSEEAEIERIRALAAATRMENGDDMATKSSSEEDDDEGGKRERGGKRREIDGRSGSGEEEEEEDFMDERDLYAPTRTVYKSACASENAFIMSAGIELEEPSELSEYSIWRVFTPERAKSVGRACGMDTDHAFSCFEKKLNDKGNSHDLTFVPKRHPGLPVPAEYHNVSLMEPQDAIYSFHPSQFVWWRSSASGAYTGEGLRGWLFPWCDGLGDPAHVRADEIRVPKRCAYFYRGKASNVDASEETSEFDRENGAESSGKKTSRIADLFGDMEEEGGEGEGALSSSSGRKRSRSEDRSSQGNGEDQQNKRRRKGSRSSAQKPPEALHSVTTMLPSGAINRMARNMGVSPQDLTLCGKRYFYDGNLADSNKRAPEPFVPSNDAKGCIITYVAEQHSKWLASLGKYEGAVKADYSIPGSGKYGRCVSLDDWLKCRSKIVIADRVIYSRTPLIRAFSEQKRKFQNSVSEHFWRGLTCGGVMLSEAMTRLSDHFFQNMCGKLGSSDAIFCPQSDFGMGILSCFVTELFLTMRYQLSILNNFKEMTVILFGILNAYSAEPGQLHILGSGPAGSGKSYLMEILKKLFVHETIKTAQRHSSKAETAEMPEADCIVHHDELPQEFIGGMGTERVGRRGFTADPATNELKTQMSSSRTVYSELTLVPVPGSDYRKVRQKKTINVKGAKLMVITCNFPSDVGVDAALLDRTLGICYPSYEKNALIEDKAGRLGRGNDGSARIEDDGDDDDGRERKRSIDIIDASVGFGDPISPEARQYLKQKFSSIQTLAALAHKQIAIGRLPQINTDLFKLVFNHIRKHIKEHSSLVSGAIRTYDKMRKMAESFVIVNAYLNVFGCACADRREITKENIAAISPYLYCTFEICVLVMSLCMNQLLNPYIDAVLTTSMQSLCNFPLKTWLGGGGERNDPDSSQKTSGSSSSKSTSRRSNATGNKHHHHHHHSQQSQKNSSGGGKTITMDDITMDLENMNVSDDFDARCSGSGKPSSSSQQQSQDENSSATGASIRNKGSKQHFQNLSIAERLRQLYLGNVTERAFFWKVKEGEKHFGGGGGGSSSSPSLIDLNYVQVAVNAGSLKDLAAVIAQKLPEKIGMSEVETIIRDLSEYYIQVDGAPKPATATEIETENVPLATYPDKTSFRAFYYERSSSQQKLVFYFCPHAIQTEENGETLFLKALQSMCYKGFRERKLLTGFIDHRQKGKCKTIVLRPNPKVPCYRQKNGAYFDPQSKAVLMKMEHLLMKAKGSTVTYEEACEMGKTVSESEVTTITKDFDDWAVERHFLKESINAVYSRPRTPEGGPRKDSSSSSPGGKNGKVGTGDTAREESAPSKKYIPKSEDVKIANFDPSQLEYHWLFLNQEGRTEMRDLPTPYAQSLRNAKYSLNDAKPGILEVVEASFKEEGTSWLSFYTEEQYKRGEIILPEEMVV